MHCAKFPLTLYWSLVIKFLQEHSTRHSCWEQRILSLSIPQCWTHKKNCLWGCTLKQLLWSLSFLPIFFLYPMEGESSNRLAEFHWYLEHNRVNSGCGESFKVLAWRVRAHLWTVLFISQPLSPLFQFFPGIWLKGVFCVTKVIKDPGLCQASLILLSLLFVFFSQTLVDVAF